jgi:hypothetical protein
VKYCPLCAAEYRETVDACATCRAALVTSLSAAQADGTLRRLLWVGSDPREFDSLAGRLRDAGIPTRLEEGAVGIFAKLMNSESCIYVLQADFDRALEVAAEAASPPRSGSALTQTCHACGAPCSAALTACPHCKAVLKVEHAKDISADFLRDTVPQTAMMKYCPLCDAEYPASHASCTVCGVDLVAEELRGRPLDERQRKERIVVVWRGGDPAAVSEVINTLRDAGIRHHVQPTNDHLVFELGMPRPKYAVRVFASDAARAKDLLADIRESAPFGSSGVPSLPDDSILPGRPMHAWNPAAATVEIWSGEDAALAEHLEACLHENVIGVRRQGSGPGRLRLLVMPVDENSAREIIREVCDATPPV